MPRRSALWRGALVVGRSVTVPGGHPRARAESAQKWFETVCREGGHVRKAWRTDDFSKMGLGDGWGLTVRFER